MENNGGIPLQAYLDERMDYLVAQKRLNNENDKVLSGDEIKDLIACMIEYHLISPSLFFSSPPASSR